MTVLNLAVKQPRLEDISLLHEQLVELSRAIQAIYLIADLRLESSDSSSEYIAPLLDILNYRLKAFGKDYEKLLNIPDLDRMFG